MACLVNKPSDWAGRIAAKHRIDRKAGQMPGLLFRRLFHPLSLAQPREIMKSFYTNFQIYLSFNRDRGRVPVTTNAKGILLVRETVKVSEQHRETPTPTLKSRPVSGVGIAAARIRSLDKRIFQKIGSSYHLQRTVQPLQTVLSLTTRFNGSVRNIQGSFEANAKLKLELAPPLDESPTGEPKVRDLIYGRPAGKQPDNQDGGVFTNLKTWLTKANPLSGAETVQINRAKSNIKYRHQQSYPVDVFNRNISGGPAKPVTGGTLTIAAGQAPKQSTSVSGRAKIIGSISKTNILRKAVSPGFVRQGPAGAFNNGFIPEQTIVGSANGLIWRKPFVAEINSDKTTTYPFVNQAAGPNVSVFTSGNGGTETANGNTALEMNLIVANVLKTLEKRMAIERDKRGRR
jgi:hypothetical protein